MSTIGFVTGVFDLFHIGHKKFLNKCKNKCDILYCGIESDLRVKKKKGETRPIQSEKIRLRKIRKILRKSDKVFVKRKESTDYLYYINPNYIFTTDNIVKSIKTTKYINDNNLILITFKYYKFTSTTKIISAYNNKLSFI